MRAYGIIKSTFWLRGSGKRLRGNPEAQVLALYLMTCSQGTMCGIFHVALPTVAHDTGIALIRIAELLVTLDEIVTYDPDEELCWIPNAAREQVGVSLSMKDKKRPGVLRELKQFGHHPFVGEFLRLYMEPYLLDAEWSIWNSSQPTRCGKYAPSKGLRSPSQGSVSETDAPSKPPVQVQVQVQDQGQVQAQDQVVILSARTRVEVPMVDGGSLDGPPPTRRENQKPPEPAQVELLDPEPWVAPSEVRPTQPWAAQALPHVPIVRSLEAVLALPINERARWYLANLHQFAAGSDWAQPQKWPEVVDALTALAEADGKALRLGGYTNDKGVQRVIAHYADGWSYDELVRAYRRIPSSTWWLKLKANGSKPTPGWVSSEVLRHAADAGDDSAEAALEVARRNVEVEKRSKVADLTANIEYRQKLIDQSDDDGWDEPDPQPQRLAAGQSLRALPSGGNR